MDMEFVTKDDLQSFRIQLLDDLKRIFDKEPKGQEKVPEWVKSGDVRKILKVSPGTLQNLRISGALNPVKIQGSWYYNLKEIELLFVQK